MYSQEATKKIASSLLPTITSSGGSYKLGTAFLVQGASRVYLVASEHGTTDGNLYHCVLPDQKLTAITAKTRDQWMPLRVDYVASGRHQVVLSFVSSEDLSRVMRDRSPIPLAQLAQAAEAALGEDVAVLGFWSKNPDLSAALRRGHVAIEGTADFLANLKILHGNSGAPVWRAADGTILGTAQKNLFDIINLETAIGGVSTLDSYSDLVAVTSLDMVAAWMASQA